MTKVKMFKDYAEGYFVRGVPLISNADMRVAVDMLNAHATELAALREEVERLRERLRNIETELAGEPIVVWGEKLRD